MKQQVKNILKVTPFYISLLINIGVVLVIFLDLYFYVTDPQYAYEQRCYGADCQNMDPNNWLEIAYLILETVGLIGIPSFFAGWLYKKNHFVWAPLLNLWWLIVIVIWLFLIYIGVVSMD